MAALAELLPNAPVYTSMADPAVIEKSKIDPMRFRTTWMDKLPLKRKLNKPLFPWYPMTFESIDFSEFDLVISSSTRFAHGIITKPHTTHVAYINSPFRGFWETRTYFGRSKWKQALMYLLSPTISYLREWDFVAGQRPDHILANSRTAQERVEKYYRRKDSGVLFPFVDLGRFAEESKPAMHVPSKYFIVVSRLVEWKRIDLAIQAANKLNKNLIVVGTGPYLHELAKLAGPTVTLAGFLSDAETTYLLKRATALIHPQKEDFGMTVIEANSLGTPVIAFAQGGATETVVDGKTGTFFEVQTPESLAEQMNVFDAERFDKNVMMAHAQKFTKEAFLNDWQEFLKKVV